MYNVITSVGRLQNISLIKNHIQPQNILWHVITDEDIGFSLKFAEPWITSYVCPNDQVEFWAKCHGALNWFIETQEINDDEMYCFMNDDDGYEPDFFNKVDSVIAEVKANHNVVPDVVIVSMQRGDATPSDAIAVRQHPTHTLFAHPDNMRVGHVGLEQIIIRGKLLKKYRLAMDVCGDGMFIIQVAKENPVAYAPHINALFNYFEPGRWNKKKTKGLFINTQEAVCSIYSSGQMLYEHLQSTEWDLDYVEVDKISVPDLHEGRIVSANLPESYDFYIFNYHPYTMRQMAGVDSALLSKLPGRKYSIILEMTKSNAFPSWVGMDRSGFDDCLIIDPTFKSNDPKLHAFPRPIIGCLPIKRKESIPDVPVIGSFGFATMNKSFDLIVKQASEEFENAIVRINIPVAQYVPNDLFEQIKAECEKHVRPGIELRITRDYMSSSDLIEWCGENDLNCFMYSRNLSGLAATPDQSIASGAPLAVSDNTTFRHLHDYIRPFPEWTFRDSILKSQDGVAKIRNAWSKESCVNRFKEIHFSGKK